ncbi:MAG TPA: acid phosphatase [Candidatus Baltobacteraceae bacterium]
MAGLSCATFIAGCNSSSGGGSTPAAATASPTAVATSAATASAAPTATAAPTLQTAIKHVIVIYQENWSFDGLYGNFPGANGLANATAAGTIPQFDKFTKAAITALPQPLNGSGAPDPNFPAGLPVQPYSASTYISPTTLTGDIVHRFYQEQSQIDGGKMDGFVTWSDNPGLVFSNFDATLMPEGQLASQYTLADNFFHSAFGGSFLNHQWLICACTPTFPGAPASLVATVDASNKTLALSATGAIVHDGAVTPDGFAVNTLYTVNSPHPATVAAANLVPDQTNPTIGDSLSTAGVTWKWYSGGWDNALAGNPDPDFQFHHQPFAFYQNFADGTAAKAAHLQDETNYFADVQNGTLPSVSFIKPLGEDNEHPGYAALATGQQHVLDLVNAVRNSQYWNSTAIIITYDENGGRWDHVAPPGPFDRWGPGTRVPAIIVSPWAKHGYIDHTQYETVSILSFIEKVWGLKPLTSRDTNAAPLSNAFDFTQTVGLNSVKRTSTTRR